MKRTQSRALRIHAETAEVMPENVDYTSRHEKTIVAVIGELMAEVTEALNITAENMHMLVAMAEIREKIANIRKSMAENWKQYVGIVADVVRPCSVKVTKPVWRCGYMTMEVISCAGVS